MKIASIVLNNFTSDNRVLKQNLSFKKAGYNPMIIALHEEGLKSQEVVDGIPVFRVKLKTKEWPNLLLFSVIKYCEFILRATRKTKHCDIVHCNDLDTLIIGYLRKLLHPRTKLVYDAHEYEIHRTSSASPMKRWLDRKMESWCIKSADAVMTVSDSIADEYSALYQIERPFLIYNCPNYAMPVQKKYNLFREILGIKESQTIFIYQGGLFMGRGIEKVIDAFKRVDDDKVVVFMGYGPMQKMVEDAASECMNIYYHPKVPMDEINRYTNSADWGLLTIEYVSKSYYYSLPNKLFEYAMAGIPMIAFPMFEIERKVKENGLGFVCIDATVDSLRSLINECERSDAEAFRHSLESFAKDYNWENQELKLLDIYRGLQLNKFPPFNK